ncbi:MAG: hypothetical protein H6875_12475 [Hyphomicrobiaceae bacterium]|nr:hypothetical protein [Hyphomicrobiaceae bacterium]
MSQAGAEGSNQDNGTSSFTDLESLKAEIERLTGVISDVTRARAEQATELVSDGVGETRRVIRRHPWAALGTAAIAGALVAIAITPRSQPSTYMGRARRASRNAWNNMHVPAAMSYLPDPRSYMPDFRMPSFSTSDIGSSIVDRLERLGNALSDIDPKSAAGPIVETFRQLSKTISSANK